jgi:CO dehydrogenase maturation factor
LEQIQRQVTRNVTCAITISDGSQRGNDTIGYITEMIGIERIAAVANRCSVNDLKINPEINILGNLPEDDTLKNFDRQGHSLWNLPPDNNAFTAVKEIARLLTKHPPKPI